MRVITDPRRSDRKAKARDRCQAARHNRFLAKLKNEPLDLVTKSFHDRAELYLHKTLGKVDFAAASSDGQKMSIDEALDLALRAVTEM